MSKVQRLKAELTRAHERIDELKEQRDRCVDVVLRIASQDNWDPKLVRNAICDLEGDLGMPIVGGTRRERLLGRQA